jgi:hypothetical protein
MENKFIFDMEIIFFLIAKMALENIISEEN